MSEDKAPTVLVICSGYDLIKKDKSFDKKIIEDLQFCKNHLLDRSYVEQMNSNYKTTGKFYKIDEEASSKHDEDMLKEAEVRRKRDVAKGAAGAAIAGIAMGITSAEPTATEVKPEGEETPEAKEAAFALYEQVFGKPAHAASGSAGLYEKIRVERARLAEEEGNNGGSEE